jgi:DNA-3-methyladenine glycosylase II
VTGTPNPQATFTLRPRPPFRLDLVRSRKPLISPLRSGDERRTLGYSACKGHVLTALAREIDGGRLDDDDLAKLDDRTLASRLCELDGLGRWSAEYVMLRGFGRVNVFPGDDVGARNKLARWMGVASPLDYPTIGGIVERWQPYAGLVYFHLLLASLANSGWLTADSPAP